jgi:hypothetical protein
VTGKNALSAAADGKAAFPMGEGPLHVPEEWLKILASGKKQHANG